MHSNILSSPFFSPVPCSPFPNHSEIPSFPLPSPPLHLSFLLLYSLSFPLPFPVFSPFTTLPSYSQPLPSLHCPLFLPFPSPPLPSIFYPRFKYNDIHGWEGGGGTKWTIGLADGGEGKA